MTSENDRDTQNQKVAKLWGSSWQRLSPKQRQLVGDIMQDVKIVSIGEQLEAEVSKIPPPNFTIIASRERPTYFSGRVSAELGANVLAITWQSVLEKTTATLLEQNSVEKLRCIFQELNYRQITNNAINDLIATIGQPADMNAIAAIEAKIDLLQEQFNQHFLQSRSVSAVSSYKITQKTDLADALEDLVKQMQSLGLIGIGAFTLAANLHLLFLQEKAKFDRKEWQNVNEYLENYIDYVKSTISLIFKLSVGKIDKACTCIKYCLNFDETPEYECRYSDGKNVYVFRDRSERVGYECNKHRLKKFHSTVDNVMQTVVQPLRSTVKVWEQRAAQVSLSPM